MSNAEKKILKHRQYFLNKLRTQMDELLFASIEQDERKHTTALDSIETTVIILWRADTKLRLERAKNAAANVDG